MEKINKKRHFSGLIFCLNFSIIAVHAANFSTQTDSFGGTMETQPLQVVQASLAEHKLKSIIDEENAFLSELQAYPERFTDNERDRRFDVVLKRYENFLLDNANDVFAHVLYAKLLRRAGRVEEANEFFMKANQMNPNIAVVKQQIGNYLAESGQYALALPYFLSAIEIEPETAKYHYQLGELLSAFKESFISSKILTPAELDKQILNAFDQAQKKDPGSWIYQMRYAEAFYDLNTPHWPEALVLWNKLEAAVAPTVKEKELVFLNKARVLIELGRCEEAKDSLAKVYSPEFEKSRRELLSSCPTNN